MVGKYDEDLHDVVSCSRKPDLLFRHSVGITSNPSLPLAGLLDTEADPNLVNDESLPQLEGVHKPDLVPAIRGGKQQSR